MEILIGQGTFQRLMIFYFQLGLASGVFGCVFLSGNPLAISILINNLCNLQITPKKLKCQLDIKRNKLKYIFLVSCFKNLWLVYS